MELPARFADFLLQVEVRTRGTHANGGIFFRNPPGTCMMGYEVQVCNRCEDGDPSKPALMPLARSMIALNVVLARQP